MKVLFSDYFNVNKSALKRYGAFDISMIGDLPLFIDPFRLFASNNPRYRQWHDQIVRYLKFLCEHAGSGAFSDGSSAHAYYSFPEVSNIYMGYCKFGSFGKGLGAEFARGLLDKLGESFVDNQEAGDLGTFHVEKLRFIGARVGKDFISDLTANLIKNRLLDYTQAFARRNIASNLCGWFDVDHAEFDFGESVWKKKQYWLPRDANKKDKKKNFVLLVPREILTRGELEISMSGFMDALKELPASVDNERLREKLNGLIEKVYKNNRRIALQKCAFACKDFISRHPEIIDCYIRWVERNRSVGTSASVDTSDFQNLLERLGPTFKDALVRSGFNRMNWNSVRAARGRANAFRRCIEAVNFYGLMCPHGERFMSETEFEWLCGLIWNADTGVKGNNAIVDFKYASGRQLGYYLRQNVAAFNAGDAPGAKVCMIFCFNREERQKVESELGRNRLERSRNIIVINVWRDER